MKDEFKFIIYAEIIGIFIVSLSCFNVWYLENMDISNAGYEKEIGQARYAVLKSVESIRWFIIIIFIFTNLTLLTYSGLAYLIKKNKVGEVSGNG